MQDTSSPSLFGLPLYDVVIPGPVSAGSSGRPIARGWLAVVWMEPEP